MLDAIVDLRTPRFLVLVRNAIGGAYASYNNYPTGADLVIALPTTRVAVMGAPGIEFVYKSELKQIRSSENSAQWKRSEESKLSAKYEAEIMNPNEALSLGSISRMVMPAQLRTVLVDNMTLHLRHYQVKPFVGVQREFH